MGLGFRAGTRISIFRSLCKDKTGCRSLSIQMTLLHSRTSETLWNILLMITGTPTIPWQGILAQTLLLSMTITMSLTQHGGYEMAAS